ncbi:MAG: DUF3995 domain-containing protein [Acidobacteria bacterium]|nr:DUF3995 domain-containing protein [Acidobacteriota bacterium]MBK8149601.1 DUF3995 domain-containing protein [Acidobacteriota bacterium]
MIRILGIVLAVVFAFLGLIHLFWAAGGSYGAVAVLPTDGDARVLNPTPAATIFVAAGLFAAMFVVLGRLRIVGEFVPEMIFFTGTWIIALLFLFRAIGDFHYVGFFKTVTGTGFARWDNLLYSPLCLFVAIAAALVAGFSE